MHGLMRFVAWNVAHSTYNKEIRKHSPSTALFSLKPDVLVLTEYVEGRDHDWFCACLREGGLKLIEKTPNLKGFNQVMIASNSAMVLEPCYAGRPKAENLLMRNGEVHARSDLLHVSLTERNLQLVVLRRPIDKDCSKSKVAYFDWLRTLAQRLSGRKSLFIGDLNIERTELLRITGFAGDGWQIADPSGEWSYKSAKSDRFNVKKSRIEHAMASSTLSIEGSKYVTERNGY